MFKKFLDRWSTSQQLAQADDFLARIRTADSTDLGMTVAAVYHTAHLFEKNDGLDLFEPAAVLALRPTKILEMSRMVESLQKQRNFLPASGLVVWVHSLRGIENWHIRPKAREIWRELSRGFDHGYEGAAMVEALNGQVCNLDRLGEFPSGLAPDVK